MPSTKDPKIIQSVKTKQTNEQRTHLRMYLNINTNDKSPIVLIFSVPNIPKGPISHRLSHHIMEANSVVVKIL